MIVVIHCVCVILVNSAYSQKPTIFTTASKAANHLGLTQQAVSEHLKKLRDVFNDRLFLRKTNGFVPTPFAQDLAVEVDKLLKDFQALLSPKVFNPKTVSDTFVISATDYAQQVVLPNLISKLRKQSPNLKLIVRDFEIDTLHELMENGKVQWQSRFQIIFLIATL